MVEEGFSAQGQAGCWEKACFSSATVRKAACRDVGRRVSEPQLGDLPRSANREKARCGWVPPRTPCVTPVLLGLG